MCHPVAIPPGEVSRCGSRAQIYADSQVSSLLPSSDFAEELQSAVLDLISDGFSCRLGFLFYPLKTVASAGGRARRWWQRPTPEIEQERDGEIRGDQSHRQNRPQEEEEDCATHPKLISWPCRYRWRHPDFKLSMCTLFHGH